MFLHASAYRYVTYLIWCLRPVHATCVISSLGRRSTDQPKTERMQHLRGKRDTRRKFRKIPEKKGTDQRQRTGKRTREKLQHAGWKEEKKKRRNRPATKMKKENRKEKHLRDCK